jgi:hypothetical protein
VRICLVIGLFRAMRRAAGAVSVTMLAGLGTAAAETPYRLYDVDVYFADESPCGDIKEETTLNAEVAPFAQSTRLGQVVSTLAEKAGAIGANMLHSIRIMSSEPGRGTVVTGIATSCVSLVSPALHQLSDGVSGSKSARVYSFPDELPRSSTIRDTKIALEGEVSGDALNSVRSYLPRIAAPRPVAPIEPCRFAPTIGIEFSGNPETWWLLSAPCRAAVLVSANDDWTRAEPFKIDVSIISEIQNLSGFK